MRHAHIERPASQRVCYLLPVNGSSSCLPPRGKVTGECVRLSDEGSFTIPAIMDTFTHPPPHQSPSAPASPQGEAFILAHRHKPIPEPPDYPGVFFIQKRTQRMLCSLFGCPWQTRKERSDGIAHRSPLYKEAARSRHCRRAKRSICCCPLAGLAPSAQSSAGARSAHTHIAELTVLVRRGNTKKEHSIGCVPFLAAACQPNPNFSLLPT